MKFFQRFSPQTLFFLTGILFLATSCQKEEKDKLSVAIWQSTDPTTLNPMNATDANSRRLCERIFQPLLQVDYETYEIVPVLAKARPTIEIVNSLPVMNFEIREEAVWDDTNEPITGYDVEFTLKIMNTPQVNNQHIRMYFKHIKDIKIDPDNPKKFKIICAEPYMLQESSLTDLLIYPAQVYDAEKILDKYELSQLTAPNADTTFANDANLKRFADNFNNVKYQENIVVGSNAYELEEWKRGEKLVLKRKENWWGDKVMDSNSWFEAFPKKLVFLTIKDPNTAVVALKNHEIDVMNRIDPREFVQDLLKSKTFTDEFHTGTPTQFVYSYIGINMKNPKLTDVNTRKALSYLMDVESYSNGTFFGLAEKISTFIFHPAQKKFINPAIPITTFNPDTAKQFLAKAGWKDSDRDGILDKVIDGQKTNLSLSLIFTSAAKTNENGVLIFQNACKEVGVEIIPTGMEFPLMLDKLQTHNFDLYFGIWGSSPLESDPTQIWGRNNFSNYVGFGTAQSDQIIANLTKELDENKRAQYYHQLQAIIYDETPYIFLMAAQNRIAISKKISNAAFSGIDPGYWVPGFKFAEEVEQ